MSGSEGEGLHAPIPKKVTGTDIAKLIRTTSITSQAAPVTPKKKEREPSTSRNNSATLKNRRRLRERLIEEPIEETTNTAQDAIPKKIKGTDIAQLIRSTSISNQAPVKNKRRVIEHQEQVIQETTTQDEIPKKVTGNNIAQLIRTTSISNQKQNSQETPKSAQAEPMSQNPPKEAEDQKEQKKPKIDDSEKTTKAKEKAKAKEKKRVSKNQQKYDESIEAENMRPKSTDDLPEQRSSSAPSRKMSKEKSSEDKNKDQNKLKPFGFEKGASTGDLKSLEQDKTDETQIKSKHKMREITYSKVTMPIKILEKDDLNGDVPLDKMIHECVMNELLASFDLFDIKGVEYLSTYDLVSAYASMGMPMDEKDCQIIIQELDKQGDGMINFSDFYLAMYDDIKDGITEEEIKFLYDLIDVDQKGFIDVDDIKILFQKCGDLVTTPLDLEDMLKAADVKNGKIDYGTFDTLCRGTIIYSKVKDPIISTVENTG